MPSRQHQRKGLIPIILLAWIAGEAAYTGIFRMWPAFQPFWALVLIYMFVKLVGDLICFLTRRNAHEWGYLDDYLLNDLLYGHVIFALPLAFAQSMLMLYYPAGSLPWRLAGTSLLAALTYGIVRYKRELEMGQSRKLGGRVRTKYSVGR